MRNARNECGGSRCHERELQGRQRRAGCLLFQRESSPRARARSRARVRSGRFVWQRQGSMGGNGWPVIILFMIIIIIIIDTSYCMYMCG